MANQVMKCKILSDKATKLLSSISNIHVESAKLPDSINLISEDCPRSSVLSEENIVFKTHATWVIRKCQMDEIPSGKYIDSYNVEVNCLGISYLWFRLYPKGLDFSVHFSPSFGHSLENIYIVCEVALVDCFKNVLLERTFSADYAHTVKNAIKFDYICSPFKIKNFEADGKLTDKLTIQCRIKLISRVYTCKSEKFTYTSKSIAEVSNLNNDILQNGKYSDITLFIESNEVKSHKYILSSESPNLHILMKVNHSDVLELDERYHLLQKLLEYMYTGKFRVFGFSDVVEFYHVSYKFEVLDLKNLCTVYLIASLTEENISYIWDLSRSHEDEYLLDACIAFVKSHKVHVPAFMKKHF